MTGSGPADLTHQHTGQAGRHRSPDFVRRLGTYGDAVALVEPDGSLITYRALADRVQVAAEQLPSDRRLLVLPMRTTTPAIVAYLAALHAGHVPVLVSDDSPDAVADIVSIYRPAAMVHSDRGGLHVEHIAHDAHVQLHPDLALLLSTSGSTGSAKLVRLSTENIDANAASIAAYLGVTSADRAITSLPLHYCYGLSVLHSYLLQGAALIVSSLSVVDPCFRAAFVDGGGTSLAGVPYTFDLLDRVDLAGNPLPNLRYITQAGGRLAADRVAAYAQLGRTQGWDLFVMYGATEATARMAYLPPERAVERPSAIGVAIPGGSFRIEPLGDGPATEGELVYTGPNVMLGYATDAPDLALGRTVTELHTGDIARLADDGLYEIVGRRSRFLKLFGLRVDLDQLESRLGPRVGEVVCTGDDRRLVVAATGITADRLRSEVAGVVDLPQHAVQPVALHEIPRLGSGKVDYSSIRASGELAAAAEADAASADVGPGGPSVRGIYESVLGRADISDDDSFISLGGDSLSHVEVAARLEAVLGTLPASWHVMAVDRLERLGTASVAGQRWASMPTDVVIRAVAIVLVVLHHMGVDGLRGGAHTLLAVAGFNVARFQLAAAARRGRATGLLATAARIAIPTWLWSLTAGVVVNQYLFITAYHGSRESDIFVYWFLEALVQLLLVLFVVFSIPQVRDQFRQRPYRFAWFVFGATLAVVVVVDRVFTPINPGEVVHRVAWVFALGWLIEVSTTVVQRLLATAVAIPLVLVFFDSTTQRIALLIGLLALTWIPSIPMPRLAQPVVSVVASASLFIYLTHFRAAEFVADQSIAVRTLVALAAGIAVWWVFTRGVRVLQRLRHWSPLARSTSR